ncbi:MAG: DUF2924 domain-containing protein [Planctomycetes bacterium]|nr:DUF2924 domain-containing protein [Planctomycetota bacterium]MCB9825242.1 DUF2924 domain-containing protein [Planctomycetota bacterium]MCB9828820.1 DUF2924 domain-containing protein [Planctomycetota bacterium]
MAAKKKTTKRGVTTRKGKRGRPTELAVGSVIEKVYKGSTYRVQVTDDGFTYRGKPYASLTAIARQITKYGAISGPRFFGTDAPKGGAA